MSSQTGAQPPSATADGVDRATAEAALERVLASTAFAPSVQSRAFLRYVADETLDGRADQLSERSVGRNALGRPELFDGRQDSLVRVQATRVRKALQAYYDGDGAADPVRVVLPQGRYAVVFEYVDRVDGSDDPVLLVTVPRALDAGATSAASAAGAAIAHALSGFPGVTVVGPQLLDGDPLVEARARRTDYVLSGSASAAGDGHRLLLQLVETRRGATLWTREQLLPAAEPSTPWARQVAAEVGDYTGVVLRNEVSLGASAGTGAPPSRVAKQAFLSFMQTQDVDDLRRASEHLEAALAEGPAGPLLLSMGAGAHALLGAYAMTDDVERELGRAESLAREALSLDPAAGLAHQALGVVALVRADDVLVRHHAELAVRCLPYHPSTLASAAALMSSVRDWKASADLMRRVVELTPQMWGPAWTIIAIERLLADDDEAALAAASHIHAPDFVWGPLYRALAYDGLGRHDRARQEMAAALEIEPRIVDQPSEFLEALWTWEPDQLGSLLARFDRYREAEAEAAQGMPGPRVD